MEIGKAIYSILSINPNISGLVGTRIFPNVAPQTTTLPFIIYDVTGVQPNDTKDGASTLDTNDVMISCYSETYTEASTLAKNIRVAMDRIPEGTYGAEQIQSSQFQSYNDIFDDTSGDAGVYRKALDFQIRQINPTGTPSFTNIYSLAFDGVDDYLELGSNLDFNAKDFSVSAWVKTTDTEFRVIQTRNTGQLGTKAGWQIGVASNGIWNVAIEDADGNYVSQSNSTGVSNFTDGNWHNIIITWNNSIGKIILYVDAVFVWEDTDADMINGNINSTNSLIIGGANSGQQMLNGNVDETSIFNVVLTQSQITTIYNNGVPTDLSSMSGLIGYWRMGDPNGQSSYPTITDDSSNSNNGIMTNMDAVDIEINVPS